jgi:hypothetical protein
MAYRQRAPNVEFLIPMPGPAVAQRKSFAMRSMQPQRQPDGHGGLVPEGYCLQAEFSFISGSDG